MKEVDMNDICVCNHPRWRHKLNIYVYKNKNIKKFRHCRICLRCKQFKRKSTVD